MAVKKKRYSPLTSPLRRGWTGFLSLFFLFFTSACDSDISSQTSHNNPGKGLIDTLLKSHPDLFAKILSKEEGAADHPNKYEIQIIYTQINRNDKNVPSFRQFDYQLDPKNYFYSASLVKLPCSALALEKINEPTIKGLDKYSRMQTDSAWNCQKTIKRDNTSENEFPSVAHYIKKMLLVSDNDAYSRVYEFLGQAYIHKKLGEKGYPDIRIVHRFDAECTGNLNSYTNPVSFYDDNGNLIFKQELQQNALQYEPPIGIVKMGKAHINNKNKLVKEPKDFTYYNYMSLQDINEILKSILFPENVSKKTTFNLTTDDYAFLYKYLSMYPRESDYPKYASKEYKDSYKKYLIYGTDSEQITVDSMRIFNIVGQSFGYLSDCAYVCDFKNKIEFMLSAVIYVNEDNIMNDGKYEYDEIGFPFLSDLGKVIYAYERNRQREFEPDLSEFRAVYK